LMFAFVRYNSTPIMRIKTEFGEDFIGLNGNGSSMSNWDYISNDENTDNSYIVIKGNSSKQWEITSVKGTWKNAYLY